MLSTSIAHTLLGRWKRPCTYRWTATTLYTSFGPLPTSTISITAPTHHEILQRIWSFSLILVLARVLISVIWRLRKWWLVLSMDLMRLVL